MFWLGWLQCALRLTENDDFELKFFKLPSMKGIKIASITQMQPENTQQNPQKVGAVPWFPVVLEKLQCEALSHWCVQLLAASPTCGTVPRCGR